ncbi:MAG TPA: hypothetical protein PKA16_05585 [Ottowia sp.]|uniref:hypothetical protein n=1 Tax=Ottowia sp. TaxID=1898956 RepID=UPI002C31325E|nr:hypothetical protein [Ottowia sp.]HMN20847.1 hypothetical protein [Ottowia sp.]
MTPPLLRRVGLLLIALVVLTGTWLVPPDAVARREVQAGLTRALTTYAAARTLGAAVAAVQGTELSLQPAGVGVALAPGQALKPISDLIEQFSTLMLAASVVFGVHLVLLAMGAHWLLSAVLSVVLVAWLALRWQAAAPTVSESSRALRRLAPLLMALLLLRFGAPLIGLGNEAVYHAFMARDYAAAQTALTNAGEVVKQELPQAENAARADEGVLERLKRLAPRLPDLGAVYARIKATVSQAVGDLVRLLAVFLLQTVVVPIGLLWLLWRLVRALFGVVER